MGGAGEFNVRGGQTSEGGVDIAARSVVHAGYSARAVADGAYNNSMRPL